MIQAKELRIGNRLYLNFGVPVTLVGLERIDNSHIAIIADDEKEWHVSLTVLSPIPLTPEILEKCGFEKDYDGNLFKHFPVRLVVKFNEANPCELDIVQDGHTVSFKFGHTKYLHTFQNFIFALTGEELQITNL